MDAAAAKRLRRHTNNIMKTSKLLLLVTSYCLLVTVFYGCATAVPRAMNLPTFNINGAPYISLVTFCEARGIDWQYDTYSGSVSISKGSHRLNLRIGEKMVLADGVSKYLIHPVEMHKGTVAVPLKFKEGILDPIFKETYAVSRIPVCPLNIRKVVVDAGHGGNDPGAMGRSGLREKDVNLDIAIRLSKLLRERGIEVVMTRSTDKFIPLPRRVEIANNSRADLFISIHSNANRVRSLKGFEVYYVSPAADDSKRALTSARTVPLDFRGSSFASVSTDLKATLWDMIYTQCRAESIELSRTICSSVDKNLDAQVLGIKGARFEVLRGIRMPGVLAEVGFVSNPSEESMLKNNYYRQRVAESLEQGIESYGRAVPSSWEVARK